MTGHPGSTTVYDPFLGKESLAALARMGFGKKEPRLGPHRFHGVGARTRLSVAGKRSVVTTSTHRHQHHKERVTINQVNDLAEIAREIDSFTKAGKRIPVAVWEKYDRVNKRHKKHEDMLALAAEVRSKTNRKRRAREKQEQEQERQQSCDLHEGTDRPNQEGGTNSSSNSNSKHHPLEMQSPADNDKIRSSPPVSSQKRQQRRTAPVPFQGGRCTFGTGRGDVEDDALETLVRRATHVPVSRCEEGHSSSWGPRERDKLNEIYWDLGRPPRRGAGAEREHFFRYTQRHCMVFPNRSPAEVVERLKLMFRYNSMKEPNEREHWLKLNARRGFFPPQQESAATDTSENSNRAAASADAAKPRQSMDYSVLTADSEEPAAAGSSPRASQAPTLTGLEAEPLFRRSGGGGNGNASTRRLSEAAASYAADAIETASLPSSSSRRLRANQGAGGAVSPFYDPIRPNSPAWGFGEASPISSSRAGSRGASRGGGGSSRGGTADSRGRGGSRGASGRAGGFPDDNDNDDDKPEETELLDYTSLGAQTMSGRATSPAFAFSREGLGSENLSMFQAERGPEPGPGSFRPNLSATSTHPGVRCRVVMGGRPGSRGGIGSGDGGGGGGGGVTGSGAPGVGAVSSTRPGPGPGHYSAWDALGRQILSTRPSSPVTTFATGDWELR